VATSRENSWPPVGRIQWPLTAALTAVMAGTLPSLKVTTSFCRALTRKARSPMGDPTTSLAGSRRARWVRPA
jgi:hypothetical protein